jgi:divalent metal cation (Fe/Co/Zn/Cd) transporter
VAADLSTGRDDHETVGILEDIVRGHVGRDARDVRLLHTEMGRVVSLNVPLGPATSLAEAHNQASELEDALRRRLPEIADVVVHTEP